MKNARLLRVFALLGILASALSGCYAGASAGFR